MQGARKGFFVDSRTLDDHTIMMPIKENMCLYIGKTKNEFDLNNNHFILGKIPRSSAEFQESADPVKI